MSKPVLYSYFRSSASWRVRIALAYKEIEYSYKPVNLIKEGGEQYTEEYKSVNPMTQVPSLAIDGAVLTQSVAIIEYLDETRPGQNLLPKNPLERANVRRITEIVNSGIQPVQNLPVLKAVGEWCADDSKKAQWGKFWIHRGFVGLEKALESTAGKYCVGDNISMADTALVPQVYNANRFSVDMSEFPIISRIHSELAEHPAFKVAHPSNQPDCPEDLKK